VSDEDKKQKLTDIPPLAAVCIVTTAIGLIVGMSVGAPIEVTGPLAGLLAALAVYIGQTLR
jgi:hypothetical protein